MKKTLHRLMTMVALLMVSCASPLGHYHYTIEKYNYDSVVREIPIWVDVSFDQEDQKAIQEAVAQWNYALNGWIKLRIVSYDVFVDGKEMYSMKYSNGWLFGKVLTTDPIFLKQKSEVGFVILGFANYIGGNEAFIVREYLGQKDVVGVMLHEIGHLLGAEHVDSGLMAPHYTIVGNQCIDKKSLEEVAKHEKLPLDTLNYCIPD